MSGVVMWPFVSHWLMGRGYWGEIMSGLIAAVKGDYGLCPFLLHS